jgi:hypothetical protein
MRNAVLERTERQAPDGAANEEGPINLGSKVFYEDDLKSWLRRRRGSRRGTHFQTAQRDRAQSREGAVGEEIEITLRGVENNATVPEIKRALEEQTLWIVRRCQEFCVNDFRLVDGFRLHWLHLGGG